MATTNRKTAVITGASSGIGAHLARCFAAAGYDLILAARRREAMEALAAELASSHHAACEIVAADLATAAGAEQLAAVAAGGARSIDALVNNAGYGLFGEFEHSDLADELAMMQLNMAAPVILTKRLLPKLRAARGHVMNVASTAAFQPGPYMAVYYASKAFVLSWSEALAEELRDSGVAVTAVCPGPVASGFQDRAAMHDSALVKGKRLPTAAVTARAAFDAMRARRRVYIPGVMNWLMAQSIRFTPRRVATAVVRMLSAPTTR